MRAHYFQHVAFEGLGSIEPWLRAHGFTVSSTRFFESAELPGPDAVDFLIVMGGPMSVNDTAELPWLAAEQRFIRDYIDTGKPVLGVCLGAQLIAGSLGADVYPNAVKEIGWFPVQARATSDSAVFEFPASETVFHWHGETFDLPPGAIRLAASEACENQAFQIGKRVIGLQFHLETTLHTARELVAHCHHELMPSRYVQTEEAILAASPARFQTINALMNDVLAYLTGA